jgi:hypothetical protein
MQSKARLTCESAAPFLTNVIGLALDESTPSLGYRASGHVR